MVIRSRLQRIKLGWNPFKDDKTQLIEGFDEAVRNENSEDAQMYYEELKAKGYI